MANIIDYIKKTDFNSRNTGEVSCSEFLKNNYFKINEIEQVSYLNYLIINNSCVGFQNIPIVYEQITQYLADKHTVLKNNIKLIGSAKTGFSISPYPNYGNSFSENSDLDFAIIDQNLFLQAVNDYKKWKKNIDNGKYSNEITNKYWDDNIRNLKFQTEKGFIDTYKIPNFLEFTTIQPLNNSMSLIVNNLNLIHNFKVKNASVRIYKSWDIFFKQIKLNTESIIRNLQ